MGRHSNWPNEKQIKDARTVLRAAYYTAIKDLADEIAGSFKDYDPEDESQRESIQERIRESVEVELTYTADAYEAIYNTDNDDAIYDAIQEGLLDLKKPNWVEQLAYYAIERDIIDALKAHHDIEV